MMALLDLDNSMEAPMSLQSRVRNMALATGILVAVPVTTGGLVVGSVLSGPFVIFVAPVGGFFLLCVDLWAVATLMNAGKTPEERWREADAETRKREGR